MPVELYIAPGNLKSCVFNLHGVVTWLKTEKKAMYGTWGWFV